MTAIVTPPEDGQTMDRRHQESARQWANDVRCGAAPLCDACTCNHVARIGMKRSQAAVSPTTVETLLSLHTALGPPRGHPDRQRTVSCDYHSNAAQPTQLTQ